MPDIGIVDNVQVIPSVETVADVLADATETNCVVAKGLIKEEFKI